MQFTINIPQEKLAKTNLDVYDGSILDYLYHYCSSNSPKIEKQRLVDDSGVWTWIDYSTLLADMPMLRLKSKNSLTPRFKKISTEGFIEMKYGSGKRLYVKLTEKCTALYLSPTIPVEPEIVKKDTASNRNDSEIVKQDSGTKKKTVKIVPEIVKQDSRNRETGQAIYDTNTSNTKTSKTGQVPCTEEELQEVATALNVTLRDVKLTHDAILDKIASKEFKNTTIYYSLRNWVRMGIQRGSIKECTTSVNGMFGGAYKALNGGES